MDLTERYLDLVIDVVNGSVYGPQSVYTRVKPTSVPGKAIGKLLALTPMAIQHVPASAYETGVDWPLPRPAVGQSMIGRARLKNLFLAVETALREEISGDFIETGVWRGGACIVMKAVLVAHGITDRRVFLADSFRGLPAADPTDDAAHLHDDPTLAVSQAQVREAFERYGLLDDGVCFLEGWFSETLPPLKGTPWAVVRLDGDQYQSTRDGIENLYPDLSPGGFLIVDDYGTYEACQRAISEYRTANGITDEIVKIDDDGVYWRKS
jgi:O-methyltransferase